MLYYKIIFIFEGIDVDKTSASKEDIVCHYWYFSDKGFRFQSSVHNGCLGVLMISIDVNSIVILNIHGVYYCCIIVGISKSEAKNLLRNADLSKNSGAL